MKSCVNVKELFPESIPDFLEWMFLVKIVELVVSFLFPSELVKQNFAWYQWTQKVGTERDEVEKVENDSEK